MSRKAGETLHSQPFVVATAPLNPGAHLVEASAGTGKTFAIAMLALRFVTEKDIPLSAILVVSFTRAASDELRDRIRARLISAREFIRCCGENADGREQAEERREDEGAGEERDPALAAWREGLATLGISSATVLHRLEMALLDIDCAPVFTIHGFCQRMLQEQALESGQPFASDLVTDLTPYRNQVVHDYWRRTVYALSPLHFSLIVSLMATPDDLLRSVANGELQMARIEPPVMPLPDALQGLDESCRRLAHWWREHGEDLRGRVVESIAAGLFKNVLRCFVAEWWGRIEEFLDDDERLRPGRQFPEKIDILGREQVRELLNGQKFRAKKDGPGTGELQNSFLDSLALPDQEVAALIEARQSVLLSLRVGLLQELLRQLPRTLRQQNCLSFDELIRQLAVSVTSPQGSELRRILRNRYTVALIDEFQDTDDRQYAIFSALFAGKTAGASHSLYLIGDPKQAIYSFRGADIYSYFKARQQATHHWHLTHNYRSHPALVEAVNRLFLLRSDAFASADLPYLPVEAAKTAADGQLTEKDGNPLPPMVFCELGPAPDSADDLWGATAATARIVSLVVAEIGRLLNAANSVMLAVGAEPARTLAPQDIAILVRNHRQADLLQTALARVGIPVVMASQQSVFATAECRNLLLLLQALSAPGDGVALKTALTAPWFAMNGQQLHALWQEAKTVDRWARRFHGYHQRWQERGFLAMMTRLIEGEGIFLALARQPLAERRITNISHLLELVQTAEAEAAMSPGRTTQWLAAMRHEALASSRAAENTELRLESDGEAVTVMTMHGVKGLEYPVVFCPFLWHRSAHLKNATATVSYHDENMELALDLGSPDFTTHKGQSLREELAEEVRLAYVALTRARYRCYAFWAAVKGQGKGGDARDSALAWLMGLEEGGDLAARMPSLRPGDGVVSWVVADGEPENEMPIRPKAEGKTGLSPLVFTGDNLLVHRQLHSYSSLTAQEAGGGIPVVAVVTVEEPARAEERPGAMPLPELPRGAALGNVIHALLEKVPFATLATGVGYENELQRQCSWFGLEVGAEKLSDLLQKTVQTPLFGPSGTALQPAFSLADLEPADIICEMPFYCRLQSGSTQQVNDALAGEPTVSPVTERVLEGYLTGFIDLVCRHQGKYYIMDYKSNWLGPSAPDYDPERLQRAMSGHNYGLQYWLYTLMLHRYLQQSGQDYDYHRDFGGVAYLFVRGMNPLSPGSGVFFDLPDGAILEKLDRCLGGSGGNGGAMPRR